ncbi:MAG: group II truncated hemoglobin [Gammaproteobacteria bacterium]|nr:group II truncated hemoglobin [Gammaproteobacteria bacterium]
MPQTPYEILGGATGVRALTDRFYDLMDTLPEATAVRALHPQDLNGSRDKLFKFLSGWFGGPALYVQEFGHPMLRARHLPFTIDKSGRNAWMLCMSRALAECDIDASICEQLLGAFFRTADHMRNQDDGM